MSLKLGAFMLVLEVCTQVLICGLVCEAAVQVAVAQSESKFRGRAVLHCSSP